MGQPSAPQPSDFGALDSFDTNAKAKMSNFENKNQFFFLCIPYNQHRSYCFLESMNPTKRSKMFH